MLSEKKQTTLNLIAKIISYGSSVLISFFLTPFLVARLGKEAYSFYPLANSFVTYMGVLTLALNSMVSRFITIYLTKGDERRANTYFVSILFANVFLSLALFIPLSLIVVFLEYILNIPISLVFSVKILFTLIFITMIVNLVTNVFGVAVFSKNRLDLQSLSEIVVGISRVLLYLLFFMFFKPNIVYLGAVTAILAVMTAAFNFGFTKKLLPQMKINRSFFSFTAVKEVVSSGAWNSVNQIGLALISTVGLMLCNRLYGTSEGGDYAIVLIIPHFIDGMVSILTSVFLPGLTIKYAEGNKDKVINHIKASQSVIGIIDNIPIAIFMAVGINFFRLWVPSVDAYKLQLLSTLCIGYLILTSVTWPISNLNTVMNKVKVPAKVMLAGGVVNIAVIYVFYRFTNVGMYIIPISQMIMFILIRSIFIPIYATKCLNINKFIFFPAIIKNLIASIAIFLISYFVNNRINPDTWIKLIIECVFLAFVALLINIVVFIKPSKIKEYLIAFKSRVAK